MKGKKITILSLVLCFFFPAVLNAQEYNSASFKLLDPVIAPSGYSTSASFKLWSAIAELATGTSTSALYKLGAGFLRFPLASTPSISATPGNASVSLSWTASSGVSGWTTSGYSIGMSTVSNGPYTYTSVGNVLTTNVTGLTNGTTYYFIVVVKDVFGNHIATSTQISSIPVAPSTTVIPPRGGLGGGGGGGGGAGGDTGPSTDVVTGVLLTGRAYPLSKVVVLRDGKIVLNTIAGPDSVFTATINGLSSGNYTFGVYGEDKNQIKSNLFTFPIYITSGVVTKIGGVFVSPTIAVDKSEVKKGDNIVIFGQSIPSSNVVVNVNSEEEHFITNKTDKDGVYLLNFDTSVLELGQHHTRSKTVLPNEISDFSNTLGFVVGNKSVPVDIKKCSIKGDLNGDCRVNLVDFSIAAFWYMKPNVATNADINNDRRVDLVDFSIMAFNWTG